MKKLAKYRCMECGHEWSQAPAYVTCTKCKCIWITWVNFEEFETYIPIGHS